MNTKISSIDLTPIYNLRKEFTVIGLTGTIGSGCSTIANQLTKGFIEKDYPHWSEFKLNHNSYRKYRILYEYAKENFKPFQNIQYKDVIFLFLFRYSFSELLKFLRSLEFKIENDKTGVIEVFYFDSEIDLLLPFENDYNAFQNKANHVKLTGADAKANANLEHLYRIFFENISFKKLASEIDKALGAASNFKRTKFFQVVANNLRNTGHPYKGPDTMSKPLVRVFTIVSLINLIVKSYRSKAESENRRTHIVIDSLRNPLEIMFFKQRYSAFYMVAVNRDENEKTAYLKKKYGGEYPLMKKIFKDEYDGAQQTDFFKQNVSECIQKADIHITVLPQKQIEEFNEKLREEKENGEKVDNTTPKFSWQMQLIKYISLIFQPGIVPPSPEERCMQMAFAAKCNSGCISRQVGAAITDEFYSIKAIGWNNTPSGQVPCILRNADDLISKGVDYDAFTPFEKNESKGKEATKFEEALIEHFGHISPDAQKNLHGRNTCFCFKSLKNSCTEGKNQVHTRSLHAEEQAFLQITKFGGEGVKGGKLFTTASPCELAQRKRINWGLKSFIM